MRKLNIGGSKKPNINVGGPRGPQPPPGNVYYNPTPNPYEITQALKEQNMISALKFVKATNWVYILGIFATCVNAVIQFLLTDGLSQMVWHLWFLQTLSPFLFLGLILSLFAIFKGALSKGLWAIFAGQLAVPIVTVFFVRFTEFGIYFLMRPDLPITADEAESFFNFFGPLQFWLWHLQGWDIWNV